MNKFSLKNFILIFLLIPFLLASCKLKQKIAFKKSDAQKAELAAFLAASSNSHFNYKTLKIRFSAKIKTGDNNLNASGQIRMIKDSLIWANATALLGIEVGRVLLTNDSAYLQNNIKHSIEIWSIRDFLNKLGIQANLSDLQAMLLGEFVRLESNDSLKMIENVSQTDSAYLYFAQYLGDSSTFDYKTFIRKNNFRVDSLQILQLPENTKFNLVYKDYLANNDKIFPVSLSAAVFSANKYEQNFVLSYRKLYFDKSFSVPELSFDNYKIIRHK